MKRYALVLLLAACHETAPSSSPVAAEAPDTVPVELRRPEGALRLAGELRPWQEVALRARLPAYVAERRVDVGDAVTKGQVLVVLSAPDRVAERAEAEAALSAARARLERLEQAAMREGVVAPLELEEARGAAEALTSRVRALTELEAELIVRAPFVGTVTHRGADDGTLVGSAGEGPLVTVADLTRLRLVVAVPETFAAGVEAGATVPFRVEGRADAPREAVVSRTSRRLDPTTRTLHVELDVDNADGALLAGSTVEVLWPLDAGEARTWVPYTALVRSTESTWVWVRRGDRLERVEVEEAMREGDRVAIRGGLGEGDLVVRRGSEDYEEGAWPPR